MSEEKQEGTEQESSAPVSTESTPAPEASEAASEFGDTTGTVETKPVEEN